MRGAWPRTLMLACLCHPSFLCGPSVPSSSMPDKNVSLCTRGPILCLKSHLHLLHSFCCPSLPPSSCLSDRLICQPRSSPPPAAAARATDTFIVLLFLDLMLLHPDQITPATCTGRRALATGAFIHPSPRPSEPLIPSSLHAVTEEWPVQRARPERDTERLLWGCVF